MNQVGGPLIVLRELDRAKRQSIHLLHKNGELMRIQRGAYIRSSVYWALTKSDQRMLNVVAAAVTHPESMAVGSTAALLRGLATPSNHSRNYSIELGMKHRTMAAKDGIRFRQMPPESIIRSEVIYTKFGSVRVSGVLDMCAELALWHSVVFCVVGIESAFSRRLLRREDWILTANEILKLTYGRKGAARAREALKIVTGFSESPRESELKLALRAAGFPPPFQQVSIFTKNGEFLGRADFMFECGLILEYDGRSKYDNSFHSQSLEQVLMDERNREKTLQNEGFVVLRIDAEAFWDQSYIAQTWRMLERLGNMNFQAPREQWKAACVAWQS